MTPVRPWVRPLLVSILSALSLVVLVLLLGAILHWRDPLRFQAAVPAEILPEILAALSSRDTLVSLYFTLYLAFRGLVLGVALSVVVGVVIGVYPGLVSYFMPIPNALRAIPLTLLIPFLVALPPLFTLPPGVQADLPARDPVYLIALGTLLYLVIGVAEGVARRDPERERIFRQIHGFSALEYFRRVLIFEALPQVLAALRLAVLLSLVLAIVFEQLIPMPGVGFSVSLLMAESQPTNAYEARALALLFIVASIGVVIDAFFLGVRRLLVRWER